jgi:ATP-dependent exoDNAse (exonuclease V) alpha subunit
VSEVECLAHRRVFEEADAYEGWDWRERLKANEFDYGYALTVHKAQGSQWDKVCLVDESWCFREQRDCWMYTGMTRAAKQLTIVRG